MLTVYASHGAPDCDGVSRRDFLRAGTLGLGALNFAGMRSARLEAAASGRGYIRDKSVVVLYLSGGASHIETFNPNMDAPAPYYSLTGEVKTSLPGVTFGGTFPQLAKLAHRMAIVRSFRHPIGGHEQAHVHVLSGGTDPQGKGGEGYSIGSFCSRVRGINHPDTGMPTFSLLTEEEVDGQYRSERGRVMKGSAPGRLGASYAPFQYDGGASSSGAKRAKSKRKKKDRGRSGTGSFAEDIELHVRPERFDSRRGLLDSLDRMRQGLDRHESVAATRKCQEQALHLLLGNAAKAFDLSSEDPRLLERYDTSDVQIGHKKFRPSTLGKQMLLARRLCESGCGFVTVHSAGWDMHADGNNPEMVKGMNMLGTTLDTAVSAFLTDVHERGLSDKILLVITGDFGRTPKINNRGGRDHWANLGTLAFAGGGLPMGQVIGRSDAQNGKPASEPITPQHMMATILHTLFDFGELRVTSGLPRDVVTPFETIAPIRELM